MSKKFYRIFLSVLVFIGLGIAIMMTLESLKPEKPKQKPQKATRFVNAKAISYADHKTEIRASGRVMAIEQINLSSEVQGKVYNGDVPLKKGARFQKGQVLVNILNDEVIYNLKSQKSRFLMSIANVLADLKLDFPDEYAEWQSFFSSVNVDEDLPPLPEINNNQLKIFLSSRNVLGEYYSIKSLEDRVGKQTIMAPFSGNFTQVNMQEGSVINPGAVIGTIINTTNYEIEVPIEKNEVKWLKTGQSVEVIPEERTADTMRGEIVRIAQFKDPQTQTIPVYVQIPAKPGQVYEGDYFDCRFENIKVKNTMELLRSAVFNHNEVFLVKDGRLKKELINIVKVNEKTLFFNGVQEGDSIVNEALLNANENMEVEIIDKAKNR